MRDQALDLDPVLVLAHLHHLRVQVQVRAQKQVHLQALMPDLGLAQDQVVIKEEDPGLHQAKAVDKVQALDMVRVLARDLEEEAEPVLDTVRVVGLGQDMVAGMENKEVSYSSTKKENK